MKHLLFALILTFALIQPGFAEMAAARVMAVDTNEKPECPFVENSNISVNFNSIETDLQKIANIMTTKIAAIEEHGREKEMTKVLLQSSNYSINVNNGNNCTAGSCQFQFYGSANFLVEPASKASQYMAYLVEKGFVASLNVNSYRQCN